MRRRHYIPNLLDYDEDLDRTNNYNSFWREHCNAYSVLSCLCWKRNSSDGSRDSRTGGQK